MSATSDVLLEVEGLRKHFPTKTGLLARGAKVLAVDGVGFSVREGETLGLVGESGCGKSTTGKLILRLLDPTEGQVLWRGRRRPVRHVRRRAGRVAAPMTSAAVPPPNFAFNSAK